MSDQTAVARLDDVPDMIKLALDRGIAGEHLEKLLDQADRVQNQQAEQSFADALLHFQAEVPIIGKLRKVRGKLSFDYGSYDDIMNVIQPYLTKNGLSVTFKSKESDNKDVIIMIARVRHGRYVDETPIPVPIPKELTVSGTQKTGAALTYAQRYALKLALGLRFKNEDDETKLLSGTQKDDDVEVIINEDQVKELEQLTKQAGSDLTVVLSHYKVESLKEMNEPSYRHLKGILTERIKGKK